MADFSAHTEIVLKGIILNTVFLRSTIKDVSVYLKFDFILNKQPLNVVDGNG